MVISFEERATGAFDPVRQRIRTARGQVRQRGADFLAYGMNLAIPEFRLPWAYPAVWAVMVAIAAGLPVMFRRKRWL